MKGEEIIKDFEIRSERIDQIPVIYGFLERMHVVEILNDVLPKSHGNWKGLNYGELGEHPISAYRLPTEVAELTPLPALFTIRTTRMVVGDTLYFNSLQVLTLIEFVVRRNLEGDVLEGLYTSNPRKKTDRPTAERILGLFKEITLYYILIGEQRLCLLSPLTPLQKRVLTFLELPLT